MRPAIARRAIAYKIYILDEAHQITDAAFNALLKTLEEPPAHIVFMMATTQPEDIPQTIRSRCQHFSFHAVKFDEIVGQLRAIASKESIQADDEALAVLAEAGDGSMRDALSIMDQAIACCGTKLSGELVRGLVGNAVPRSVWKTLWARWRAVRAKSSAAAGPAMTEGHNPAHFARQFVRFLRNALVAKVAGRRFVRCCKSPRTNAPAPGGSPSSFQEEDLARFLANHASHPRRTRLQAGATLPS